MHEIPQTSDNTNHDDAALIEVIERRNAHRVNALFTSSFEWTTALVVEMGKAAIYAENLGFDQNNEAVKANLRAAIVSLGALSLAWLDHIESPNTSRTTSGMLVRAIENDWAKPSSFDDPPQS